MQRQWYGWDAGGGLNGWGEDRGDERQAGAQLDELPHGCCFTVPDEHGLIVTVRMTVVM